MQIEIRNISKNKKREVNLCNVILVKLSLLKFQKFLEKSPLIFFPAMPLLSRCCKKFMAHQDFVGFLNLKKMHFKMELIELYMISFRA